jgi:hypothetical protein
MRLIKAEIEISKQLLANAQSIEQYANTPYAELLQTAEWRTLRTKILERDSYTCATCYKQETYNCYDKHTGKKRFYEVKFGDNQRKYLNHSIINGKIEYYYIFDDRDILLTETQQSRTLHIHHRYYIAERLPWHYDWQCFKTLCINCHYNLHKETVIPFFEITVDENKTWYYKKTHKTPCYRCHGAGHFPQFSHVEYGICFRCRGERYEQLIKK